jgi:cytochrome P450
MLIFLLIDVFNFTLVHHGPADRWGSSDRDNWYVAYIELFPGYSTDISKASWIITFLGGHADWRHKAKTEVESLLATYSDATTSSLSARLAEIPLEIWESQTPVLDAIIRETLRVAQPHTAMRRNLGPEVYINDKSIPSGAYVVYRTHAYLLIGCM